MVMKRSILWKMVLILVFIVSSILCLVVFLNYQLGEEYYISSGEKNMTEMLKDINKVLDKYSLEDFQIDSTDARLELESLVGKTNMTVCVAYNSYRDIYTNGSGRSNVLRIMYRQFEYMWKYEDAMKMMGADGLGNNPAISEYRAVVGKVGGKPEEIREIIEEKGYCVCEMTSINNSQKGLYLFSTYKGNPEHNLQIGIQISLDGIKEFAKISNRLIMHIGLVGLLAGVIVIIIFASSFTRPIKDMARVANRMAALDFDAKVKVDRTDELGVLGHAMNELSEKLETTISELKRANAELQRDIQKKEEIDEMRKDFLSHVSHELKTPIALIQGYAEGLQDNINEDQESRDFYCEVIMDEAKKMNVMVKKLLSLNQIEFGNNQIEIQRFDICQLISNKINASTILFTKKNVNVVFREKGPVYVWADELMIEEVFSNYLSNAINHVYQDGMIMVWFENLDSTLRVHVYNDGNQIPEEDLDKLWIKFYKVDKARTREYGGNGIGLSIVAATMEAHGKDYGVENKENGVDFYFDMDQKSV